MTEEIISGLIYCPVHIKARIKLTDDGWYCSLCYPLTNTI